MVKADADRSRQRGLTLVELLVTTLILGLILSAATASFIAASNGINSTDNRVENLGEAQKLIATTTKDLRTAISVNTGQTAAFIQANATEVEFYANLNTSVTATAPSKLRIYVDTTDPAAQQLVETIQQPNLPNADPPAYGTYPAKVHHIGRYVANPASEPIFRYYDLAGDLLTLSATPTQEELNQIAVVKVKLMVRRSTGFKNGFVTIENRVRLPNIIYRQVQTLPQT